jgi:hypothetical protein
LVGNKQRCCRSGRLKERRCEGRRKRIMRRSRVTREQEGIVAEDVRFEVFTAVTMKNVIFWDIKPQIVLHRGHVTSPLQGPAG